MAITASTLTTIVVFLPMVFATGITAKFTRGLALAVAFSLVSSLFVALTVVPLLASFLFRKGKIGVVSDADAASATGLKGRLMSWQGFEKARAKYRRALEATLRRRKLALGLVILAFVLSLAAVPFLGTEFMPVMDQDMLFIKLGMPVGTSLEETNRVSLMVEELARKQPEVNIITAQVGSQAEVSPSDSASEMSASGTHEAILYIGLKKKELRKRSGPQVLEALRSGLPKIKGLKFDTLDVSSGFMGGSRTPVDIKLFGKDLGLLKTLADRMVERVRDVPGIRDATHSLASGKPEYHIRLDRVRAAQLGLMVGQVGTAVQTATIGKVATRYRDADEEIDVRVRFQERYRDSIDEVRSIPLVTAANKTVYVDQIATLESGSGPIQITRENQARRVSLTANVIGRDLGSVIRDVKSRLAGFEKELPSGYFLEYGGAYEQMIDAFKILFAAFALATLLVYMVMASQFESLLHPFIIMFTIPLGFIGVVAGLFLWGMTVNLPVLIGFILLEGIAVNNGIVMIDYVNQLVRSGVEKKEAILRGCATRLRPVLLTALTTILGMLPMAMTKSSGAEMRAPIAVTVLAGLDGHDVPDPVRHSHHLQHVREGVVQKSARLDLILEEGADLAVVVELRGLGDLADRAGSLRRRLDGLVDDVRDGDGLLQAHRADRLIQVQETVVGADMAFAGKVVGHDERLDLELVEPLEGLLDPGAGFAAALELGDEPGDDLDLLLRVQPFLELEGLLEHLRRRVGRLGLEMAFDALLQIGVEDGLRVRIGVVLASQEQPIEPALPEQVEGELGRLLEVLQDVGFEVPLDPPGRGTLETGVLHPAGDVARQALERRDPAHMDVVEPRLSPAEEQDADPAVFFQDGQERPDIEILVEDDPVPRAMGQVQGLEEAFRGAREYGQAREVVRGQALDAEGGDGLEVPGQGLLLVPGEVRGLEADLALLEEPLSETAISFFDSRPLSVSR